MSSGRMNSLGTQRPVQWNQPPNVFLGYWKVRDGKTEFPQLNLKVDGGWKSWKESHSTSCTEEKLKR